MAKTPEEQEAARLAKEQAKAEKEAAKAAAKAVKDAEKAAAKTKDGEVAKSSVDHDGKDFPESVRATNCFEVVIIGTEGRVYGKQGQPISPVMPAADADDLCRRSNRLDPERSAAKGE